MKTKVHLSFIFVSLFILTSCASRSQLKKSFDAGYRAAQDDFKTWQFISDQHVAQLKSDINKKDERLRKYNQLNSDGTLRTRANDHQLNYNQKQKEINGSEGWMK